MSALATKLNFEHLLGKSEPNEGYREDRIVLPQGVWRNGPDGTVLTGVSTPAVAVLNAATELVQWATNAAVTIIAAAAFVMPAEYGPAARADGSRNTDDLVFLAKMRRQRNAADASAWNARLAVHWWTPGVSTISYTSFTTPPVAAVPAIPGDNTAVLSGFAELTFDLGSRLRTENKRILAGDVVRLLLGPDAQNASAVLQFAGGVIRLRRHACLADRSLR